MEAMTLEQPAEVGTIESGKPCPRRDRSPHALHHADEIAPLELSYREALGLCEGQRHQDIDGRELGNLGNLKSFHVRGSLDENDLAVGKIELLHHR